MIFAEIMAEASSEWADFEEQCRRQLERPLEDRMRYGWCRPPVPPGVNLPSEPYRSFDTMAEYRQWMERHYPEYYGYGPARA